MQIEREYYVHESVCTRKDFYPTNARGLKQCKDCAGVFDAKTGNGVAVTDKRFDENYEEHKAEVEADSRGENI
jgi:hypothetical protein